MRQELLEIKYPGEKYTGIPSDEEADAAADPRVTEALKAQEEGIEKAWADFKEQYGHEVTE